MDPVLIAAARKVAAAIAAAKAAGQTLAPEDLDAFVKEETAGKYAHSDVQKYLSTINPTGPVLWKPSTLLPGVANAARSALNAGTFGLASHAADLLGKGVGEDWRARSEAFQREHPVESAVYGVGGGLLAGSKLPLGPEPTTLPGAMLKSSGVGVGSTAVAGAANAEPGHRMEAALDPQSLLLALGISAAVPVAAAGVSAIRNPAAFGARRLKTAIEQSGGVPAIMARSAEMQQAGLEPTLGHLSVPLRGASKWAVQNSEEAAAARMEDQMRRNASNPQEMLDKFRGMVTAPTADRRVSGTPWTGTEQRIPVPVVNMAERSRQMLDNGKQRAAELLQPGFRPTPASPLTLPELPPGATPATPWRPGLPLDLNAPVAETALAANTRAWAKGQEGYGGLRENNPNIENTVLPTPPDPRVAELNAQIKGLQDLGVPNRHPKIQELMSARAALKPQLNEEEAALMSLMKQPVLRGAIARAQKSGEIGATPEPRDQASFEKMFQFKQDVQDAADRAINAGGGKSQHGFNLKEAAKLIDEHLQNNVDQYGAVSKEYRTRMGLSRAFEKGHEMFASADSRDVAPAMAKMSLDEQHNARLAIASDIVAKLRNPTQAASFSRQIMKSGAAGASENALQDKLHAVFSDQAQFEKYMKYADFQHELGRMTGAYTGSDTYRNFMAGETSPLEVGVKSATSGLVGNPLHMLKGLWMRSAASRALPAIRRSEANAMSGPLMTKGHDKIGDMLDEIMRRRPVLSPIATQGVPAALSSLLTRQP
jgi:hypothetical protein